MPRPSSSGQQVTGSYNVASANSTLNTFMGGKQKSWMTTATPVQPSPRPPRPVDNPQPPAHAQTRAPRQARRASQQQISPADPPNLLPSPAPSDEPSPSLSNPKVSPGLRSHALTQTQQKQPLTTHAPAAQQIISPDSREQVEIISDLASPNAGPEAYLSATTQTAAEQVLPGAQLPQAMPPPRIPGASRAEEASVTANVPLPEDPSNAAQPRHNPTEGPPAKKRRVGPTTPNMDRKMTELVKAIDKRVEIMEGCQMANDIERPRFQLLKEACFKRDFFYLHLHSLYCTWSISPSRLPPMLGHDMNTIHQGFGILESVLKKNDQFTQPNLEWCANFPNPEFNTSHPAAVAMVARFLASLLQYWSALGQKSVKRRYPYLVDELLGRLQCFSDVMQGILFTACRRRLGLVDGELGAQTHLYFEQDQKQHLDEGGQFRSVSLSDDEIERRNQNLITVYRQLVEGAKNEQCQHIIRQSQQAQQQFQQQQTHAQDSLANSTSSFASSHAPHNNAHYTANQMAMAVASQARRWSFNPSSPLMQPPNQTLSWQQQTSSSHSGAGSPTMAQAPLDPQAGGRPLRQVPSNFTLQSSAAAPNLSDAAMMQMVANQQFQPQVVSSPQQYHINSTPQGRDFQAQMRMQQFMPRGPLQPQWSQVANQPFVPNHFGPQMQFYSHTQAFNAPFNPQASVQQPSYMLPQSRGPMVQHHVSQQSVPMALNNTGRVVLRAAPLVPQPGQIIDRSQYPHSHQERKSLLMAIHQLHARSPERTRRIGEVEERHYQSVQSFAVAPFRLAYLHQLDIAISWEQYSRLCRKKEIPQLRGKSVTTTAHEYTSGSLRLRARCCRLQAHNSSAESDWVTRESMWPEHIYIRFNDHSLTIRRSTHNGKDLPVELTDFVRAGVNKFEVATSNKGPTASDKGGNSFYMAVEIVETASHSDILKNVQNIGRLDREVTLARIRSRVNAVPDEDGIAIIDRTGDTTQELSIDLTDPFSAKIFEVPARGIACTHMECFDLETWLATRPTKQQIKCGHKDVCTCPRRVEPSEPDRWKCPICFGDARPGSLRIDTFLEDVRKQLQTDNKLETKSILVTADGMWRPVVEPADDDDDSDVDRPVPRRTSATLRNGPNKSTSIERAPVEVIELD